jgi:hypothetical protein
MFDEKLSICGSEGDELPCVVVCEVAVLAFVYHDFWEYSGGELISS